MESSSEIAQQQVETVPGRTLQVDFSWRKFKSLITYNDDPESKPIYIVDYECFKPHLVFKSAADNATIGTGSLHTVSIDADCELRGQAIALKAMRRFKTEYTHLSHAFSTTDKPVTMTWTSNCGFTTWNFICLDEQQMPVAKFSANVWAMKKIGNIEFLGEKANDESIREEIIVVGLTLFYCMTLRTNNIFNLFGAIFSRPGHNAKDKSVTASEQTTGNVENGKAGS